MIAGIVALLGGMAVATPPRVPGEYDVWELSQGDATLRWLVIYNLADGRKSGVYHVEVLERKVTDPAWRFTRLAAHMAVSEAALRASVRRPLGSGRVYPEHFNQAFAEWQKQRAAGTATVCERTVLKCLDSKEGQAAKHSGVSRLGPGEKLVMSVTRSS